VTAQSVGYDLGSEEVLQSGKYAHGKCFYKIRIKNLLYLFRQVYARCAWYESYRLVNEIYSLELQRLCESLSPLDIRENGVWVNIRLEIKSADGDCLFYEYAQDTNYSDYKTNKGTASNGHSSED